MASADLLVRGEFDASGIDRGVSVGTVRLLALEQTMRQVAGRLPDINVEAIIARSRALADAGIADLKRFEAQAEATRANLSKPSSIILPFEFPKQPAPAAAPDLSRVFGAGVGGLGDRAVAENVERLNRAMLGTHQSAESAAQGSVKMAQGMALAGGASVKLKDGLDVSHFSARRLAQTSGLLAAQMIGVEGPIARLAEMAIAFSGGLGLVVGLAGGVIALVGSYKFLNKEQADEEAQTKKLTDALLDQAHQAMPEAAQAARGLAAAHERAAKAAEGFWQKVGEGAASTVQFLMNLPSPEAWSREIKRRAAKAVTDAADILREAERQSAVAAQKPRDIGIDVDKQRLTDRLALTQQTNAAEQAALKDSLAQRTVSLGTFYRNQRGLIQQATDAELASISKRIDAESGRDTLGDPQRAQEQARNLRALFQEFDIRKLLGAIQQQALDREVAAAAIERQRQMAALAVTGVTQQAQQELAARQQTIAADKSIVDQRLALAALGLDEEGRILAGGLAKQSELRRRAAEEQIQLAERGRDAEVAALNKQLEAVQRPIPHATTAELEQQRQAVGALQEQIRLADLRLGITENQVRATERLRLATEAQALSEARLQVAGTEAQDRASAREQAITAARDVGAVRLQIAQALASTERALGLATIREEERLRKQAFQQRQQDESSRAASDLAALRDKLGVAQQKQTAPGVSADQLVILKGETDSLKAQITQRERLADLTRDQITAEAELAAILARQQRFADDLATAKAAWADLGATVGGVVQQMIQGTLEAAHNITGFLQSLDAIKQANKDIEAVRGTAQEGAAQVAKALAVVGAVGQAIGAAVSVGKAIFGPSAASEENKRLMEQNNKQLETLSSALRHYADTAISQRQVGLAARGAVRDESFIRALFIGFPADAKAVLVKDLESFGVTLQQAEAVAKANGIELFHDGQLVSGSLEALAEATGITIKSMLNFGTSLDEQRARFAAQDRIYGVGGAQQQLGLQRGRFLLNTGFDSATQYKVSAFNLATEQGRKAYLQWVQQMYELARAGKLTADQLKNFPDVQAFVDSLADGADLVAQANREAADQIQQAAEKEAQARADATAALQKQTQGVLTFTQQLGALQGFTTAQLLRAKAQAIPATAGILGRADATSAAARAKTETEIMRLFLASFTGQLSEAQRGGLSDEDFRQMLVDYQNTLKQIDSEQLQAAKTLRDTLRSLATIRSQLTGALNDPGVQFQRRLQDFVKAFPSVHIFDGLANTFSSKATQADLRRRLIAMIDALDPGDAAKDEFLAFLQEGADFLSQVADNAKKMRDALAEEQELRGALAGAPQDASAKFAREVARVTSAVPSFKKFFDGINVAGTDPATKKALQNKLLALFDQFNKTDFTQLEISRDEFIQFLKDGANYLGLFGDQVNDATKSMLNFPTGINLTALEFQAQAAGAQTTQKLLQTQQRQALTQPTPVALPSSILTDAALLAARQAGDGASLPQLTTTLQALVTALTGFTPSEPRDTISVGGDLINQFSEIVTDPRALARAIAARTRRDNLAKTGDTTKAG